MGTKGIPIERWSSVAGVKKTPEDIARRIKERRKNTRGMKHHRKESQADFAESLDKFFSSPEVPGLLSSRQRKRS